MKKIILLIGILALIALSACEREDLVEGSIPPKGGGKVDFDTMNGDTAQMVIYFKDRIDPDSLAMDREHILLEVIEEGNVIAVLAGDSVFKPYDFNATGNTASHLAKSDTVDDTAVLVFNSDFKTNYLAVGRIYSFWFDQHQLWCTTQGQEPPKCPLRNRPAHLGFELAQLDEYEAPYSADEDPPYIIKSSPPDEIDFPNAPPFPPHGDIQIEFSETVPSFTLAASSSQPAIGDTLLSAVPDDLVAIDPETGDTFDSSIHTKLKATTVQGWPINTTVSLTIISTPSNINDYITCAVQDGGTDCPRPPLSNMLLTPTQDSSGAPIIMAQGDTLQGDTIVNGIYWGTYQVPSGAPGPGNQPDNIDILVHFGRVRIDNPRSGKFFNLNHLNGCTVSGIYTIADGTTENVTNIKILLDGNTLGDAVLQGGTTVGHFYYEIPSGLTVGHIYEFRAVATAPDGRAGFDVINGKAASDHTRPSVNIASPADGAYLNSYLVPVLVQASDTATGIEWVKVNDQPALLQGATYVYNLVALDEGPLLITATASDGVGNLSSDTVSVIIDTTPPDLWVLSPPDGSYLNTREISVIGTIYELSPITAISVNGVPAVLNGSTFTATLTAPADGSTTIIAQATDQAGNTGYSWPVIVTIDTVPPQITIVQPQDGATTNSAITINITYSDASSGIDLNSLVVYHNNTDITSTLTKTGSSATGSVTAEVGGNVFNVRISDLVGNTGFDSALVLYEDGADPIIGFILPVPGSTVNTNTPTFIVEYSDLGSGVDLNTLHIWIDSTEYTAEFLKTSTQATWRANYNLSDGPHTWEAQICDMIGRCPPIQSSSFNINNICPAFSITTVTPDFTIGGDTVRITGTNFGNTVNVIFTGSLGYIKVPAFLETATQVGATVPASALGDGEVRVENPAESNCDSNPLPFHQALPYALIANRLSHRVTRFNYTNNSFPTPSSVLIPGTNPTPYGIDITPDGQWAFVANRATNSVTVVNTLTGNTVNNFTILCGSTVDRPSNPQALAITPDGSRAIVASNNRVISVIDIKKVIPPSPISGSSVCQVIQNKLFNYGSSFFDLDFTPDGEMAMIATNGSVANGVALKVHTARNYIMDGSTEGVHFNYKVNYLHSETESLPTDAGKNPYGVCMLPQRLDNQQDYLWGTLIVNKGSGTDTDEDTAWMDLCFYAAPGIILHDVIDTNISGLHPLCNGGADAAVSNLGERAFIAFTNTNNIGATGLLEGSTNNVLSATTVNYYSGSMRRVVYTPYREKVLGTMYGTTWTDSGIMVLDASTLPINYTGVIRTPRHQRFQHTSIVGPEFIAVQPLFDRDGDGISDLVEARNQGYEANIILHPTVPDFFLSGPASPLDSDTNGTLTNGILLPNEGIGYRHFYNTYEDFNRGDNYGSLRLIQIIESVGREWNLRHPNGPRISINDISLKRGGYFDWTQPSPGHHSSHQAGRDADLRYVRSDGTESNYTFNLNPPHPPGYSQGLTQDLINLFCEAGVTTIYADNDANLQQPSGCTITDPGGHQNHIHIKISP